MKPTNCFSELGRSLRAFEFAVIVSAMVSSTNAATIVWTNTAGGNWSNPLNWSPNQVPGQLNDSANADDVTITAGGYYTVTFDVGISNSTNYWGVNNVTVGGLGSQILSIANRATLHAAQLNVMGGSELYCGPASGVSAPITISNGGQLNSWGGTFYGPVTIEGSAPINGAWFYSPLTVSSSGNLTISGSFLLFAPMTNSGTINFINNTYGGNAINIYNDGTTNFQGSLVNLSGGFIKLDNGTIQGGYGHESFLNRGVLTSTNSGTVNVPIFDNSAGVITNWSGGASLGQFTNGFVGTFYASSSAPIQLNGGTASAPLTPGQSVSFYGSGGYAFTSGFLLLTNNLIPNLALSFGNLELGPHFQGGAITNLTIGGMWLTNNTLPVTGTMTVNGSTAHVFGGLTISNGGLLNANFGTYHGSLLIASNGTMTMGAVSIGSDASLTVYGMLNISNYFTLSGLLTNFNIVNLAGTLNVANNGINFFGGVVNQSGGVMNVLTNAGIQSAGGGKEFLVNNGATIKSGNNTVVINLSKVTNSGSITVQQGTLQFSQITLFPAGNLNVQLNSKNDYGKISISNATPLSGGFGVTVASNYWPSAGDSFQPLTYSSYMGNFTATNLPPAIPMRLSYNPAALTLQVMSSTPIFTTSVSSSGKIIFGGSKGLPGNTYLVLTSTNLTHPLTNWTTIATNQFDNNGNFIFTNSVNYASLEQFFILEPQ